MIIFLDNGERITLDPLGPHASPSKLSIEIAVQVGAKPALKTADVLTAVALFYALGEHHESVEVSETAWELGAEYLKRAAEGEVVMSEQASHWAAFSALERHAEHSIVLRDTETGLRYVRLGWFAEYVRERLGAGASDAALRQMPTLGWSQRGSEGRIKATRPEFKDRPLNFRFFIVPDGWEEQ